MKQILAVLWGSSVLWMSATGAWAAGSVLVGNDDATLDVSQVDTIEKREQRVVPIPIDRNPPKAPGKTLTGQAAGPNGNQVPTTPTQVREIPVDPNSRIAEHRKKLERIKNAREEHVLPPDARPPMTPTAVPSDPVASNTAPAVQDLPTSPAVVEPTLRKADSVIQSATSERGTRTATANVGSARR